MEKIQFEILEDFDINSIDIVTRNRKWAEILDQWRETTAKTLKFSLKNMSERNACCGAIQTYKRQHNLDWTTYRERNTYNVYVVRS